jgi:hypothetical protein
MVEHIFPVSEGIKILRSHCQVLVQGPFITIKAARKQTALSSSPECQTPDIAISNSQ